MKTNIFSNPKGDILGGITAGVIALPLAIALGVASGLGATAGLYGAIIVGLLAAIFGGTPTQITGPTGPMAVVLASMVALNPNNTSIVFTTIFIAGIIQILLGCFKVGKLVNFIPYPVISGFMSGIGAIIILLQLNPILGLEYNGTPFGGLINVIKNADFINYQSLILGLISLLIVFFTPKKLASKVPPPLIALVAGTIISSGLGLNVSTIGEIPVSFPKFIMPVFHFADLKIIISMAVTLAVLGSIDSLLTSLVADSLTKTKHHPNKELIGQGIGNAFAGLFGGVASAGATMRTVVNIKTGGKTLLSGIIHSVFLMMVILFFAPVASQIPLAVLAGILVKVGISIIDYKFLKVLKAAPRSDLFVMLAVFFITVFYDLITAVGVGIVLSAVLFASHIAKEFQIDIDKLPNCASNEDCFDEIVQNKIMILKIDGVLFFGSASQIMSRIDEVMHEECVIIDCSSITSMDISAVFALEDLIMTLKDKKIKVIIIFNNRLLAARVLRSGLRKIISKDSYTFSKKDAVEKAQQFIANIEKK